MSYDRVELHWGGDYPAHLPPENGGTHIGMYMAWAFENGMAGPAHRQLSANLLRKLAQRKITGRDFLITACRQTFWSDDLNETGQDFTSDYYEARSSFAGAYGWYFDDYRECFKEHVSADGLRYESIYNISDTWENYDFLKPQLDMRFRQWEAWRLEPINAQRDPRMLFRRACREAAIDLVGAGFKPTRRGAVWTKTAADHDTIFRVAFELAPYHSRHDVRMSAHVAVYSRELKSWLIEQTGSRDNSGLVSFEKIEPKQREQDWTLTGLHFAPTVGTLRQRIDQMVTPLVELYSDRARALEHLAAHGNSPLASPFLQLLSTKR